MSKKLKNEELTTVSGGDAYTDAVNNAVYTCKNPNCKKQFKRVDAVCKNDRFYCPYCGSYYAPISLD